MNMVLGSMLGNPLGGGLDKITGGGDDKAEGGEKAAAGEDPEVIQARLEAEERRKDKHRKMEAEREGMRQSIRDKYGIKKKEDDATFVFEEAGGPGRVGASKHKSPEELASEGNTDDSLMGQMTGMLGKAKTQAGGLVDTVKGFLPFGK